MSAASGSRDGEMVEYEGRPALRFVRALDFGVDRVWRAITDPDQLAEWFPGRPNWELEVGATFDAAGQPGTITELDAPRLLAYDWGDQRVRFELTGGDTRCTLVFLHCVSDVDDAPDNAVGWEYCFERLAALLEGGDLAEIAAPCVWGAPQLAYAKEFGIDPSAAQRAAERNRASGSP